jgi:hypothetical protein
MMISEEQILEILVIIQLENLTTILLSKMLKGKIPCLVQV